jgi:hypothetical protein
MSEQFPQHVFVGGSPNSEFSEITCSISAMDKSVASHKTFGIDKKKQVVQNILRQGDFSIEEFKANNGSDGESTASTACSTALSLISVKKNIILEKQRDLEQTQEELLAELLKELAKSLKCKSNVQSEGGGSEVSMTFDQILQIPSSTPFKLF